MAGWKDPPGAVHRLIAELDRHAADDEIVRLVAEDRAPASITVVTSDDLLAQRVRERGASVMSSMTFRRRLDQKISGRGDPSQS